MTGANAAPVGAREAPRGGTLLLDDLLTSSSRAAPLRVAVFLDGPALPRPHALALDLVRRCTFAAIVLAVVRAGPGPRARKNPLFDLYERWDRRRAREAARQLCDVEVAATLAAVPRLEVRPVRDGSALLLPPDAIGRLSAEDVDVALRFGFDGLAGDALAVARHGVWSWRYGDPDRREGSPPQYWELAQGNPVSQVALEAEGGPWPGRVALRRGAASTASARFELSVARSRTRPQLLAASFAAAAMKELHEEGADALARRAVAVPSPARPRGPPSVLELGSFLLPRLAGKARARLARRTETAWRLGVRVGGAPPFDAGKPFTLDGFRWIDQGQGGFQADPCLVEDRGTVWCFYEHIDGATHRGTLSCAALDADGRLRDARRVLELPYHLSYPFVFQDGAQWFMVPESRRNGTVDLFRAVEFPDRWEKVRTLLQGPAFDTTVLRHGGRWWFFATVREPPGAGEQLLLFCADALDADLKLHRRSPISSDIRYCRSAGPIFGDRGRLIRPSQDCSVTYGYQLHFHEIAALTPDEYEERLVTTAAPPPGIEGIHTYSRCGSFEVIDGKRTIEVPRR